MAKKKKNKLKHVEEFCMNNVDMLNLEKEVAQHSKMVFQYARMLNICNTKIGEKKSEFALRAAEIEADIRARPDEYALPEKPTVTAINSTILRQRSHKKINTQLMDLQKRQGILSAAVKTLDHKKSMIEQAVKLHGQNYFSTPTIQMSGQEHADFQRRVEDEADVSAKVRSKARSKKSTRRKERNDV